LRTKRALERRWRRKFSAATAPAGCAEREGFFKSPPPLFGQTPGVRRQKISSPALRRADFHLC
jgi:hypothetical protein